NSDGIAIIWRNLRITLRCSLSTSLLTLTSFHCPKDLYCRLAGTIRAGHNRVGEKRRQHARARVGHLGRDLNRGVAASFLNHAGFAAQIRDFLSIVAFVTNECVGLSVCYTILSVCGVNLIFRRKILRNPPPYALPSRIGGWNASPVSQGKKIQVSCETSVMKV